ncbi:MAG: DUF2851 family protein [Cyclobacteriaceae bacterium]|nr:DUF2851 family protein [Cyclobacteriaceae bacterium]
MHESFLSYLWQLQYFDKRDLKTTDHEKIEIYHPGFINTNAGPDFSNSRIKIGSMDWVGSVEIHTVSSEWFAHHHDTDRAYDNVILHLVWQHDKEIVRTDNTILPTLELKGRVDESLIKTYRQLVSSSFSIPCQRSIMNVEGLTRLSMIEKAMLERLERKAIEITAIYSQNGNSWEETFYQLLARNFGFKINSEPFFQLAKLLPLKIIQKQADKKEQVEALLFGQAGFLEPTKGDEYFLKLRREHILLTQKYSLLQNKMSKAQWRFLRLRPANFPSLRLAQFASILHSRQNIFSAILGLEDIKSIANLFSVTVSDYWLHHYQFSKQSKSDVHELGKSSIENIIINTIVPVWVAYGRMTHEQRWIDLSVHILQQLPAEENNITRAWKGVGMDANNSFDSQGLIELYNNFCQQKNCLNCTIGASLMRPAK